MYTHSMIMNAKMRFGGKTNEFGTLFDKIVIKI